MKKKCLILANGRPPKKSEINLLKKYGYAVIICADGGANTAYRLGVTPDYIIGDLDSITGEVYEYYAAKSIIKKVTRQNDTDVEKALKFAISKKFDEVILLGSTGDRLDHSFCNLGIVLKFSESISINILHEKSYLTLISGNNKFAAAAGDLISIYGFDKKTKFTTHGLKYKLKNESLPFGIRESTSNIATSEEVIINVKGGKAFLIRNFNDLVKNGYFYSA
ncbi:MAG: thiamine diphosphokinase [Melioribacteraceae bacterium]|nr:thiamine diphosphokinase [Melioribacteraceae bacterium]MCF8355186.1 thiamine diphosphokinase [Melioribacteraceae bacterium]MCF8395399.1 thiamine diphosphokinase [Melioribacteraceae bacterium]MCF8419895.1 thiamine diphosphokinase [Melioribacteraceae bacterium]